MQIIAAFFFCAHGQTANSPTDYKAQTLFIYNFTKYITWQENNNKDFIIAIFFDSPIKPYLEELSKIKKVGNKPIVIKIISSFEEMGTCDVLYIDGPLPIDVKDEQLKNILVVTEAAVMPEKFSCINFQKVNNSYKFEISEKNMDKNKLAASSLLLNLAIKVIK